MLNSAEESRLDATACTKNLSNADANVDAFWGSLGLLEAWGDMAVSTCMPETGAMPCTAISCLALMNLLICQGLSMQKWLFGNGPWHNDVQPNLA